MHISEASYSKADLISVLEHVVSADSQETFLNNDSRRETLQKVLEEFLMRVLNMSFNSISRSESRESRIGFGEQDFFLPQSVSSRGTVSGSFVPSGPRV